MICACECAYMTCNIPYKRLSIIQLPGLGVDFRKTTTSVDMKHIKGDQGSSVQGPVYGK